MIFKLSAVSASVDEVADGEELGGALIWRLPREEPDETDERALSAR